MTWLTAGALALAAVPPLGMAWTIDGCTTARSKVCCSCRCSTQRATRSVSWPPKGGVDLGRLLAFKVPLVWLAVAILLAAFGPNLQASSGTPQAAH